MLRALRELEMNLRHRRPCCSFVLGVGEIGMDGLEKGWACKRRVIETCSYLTATSNDFPVRMSVLWHNRRGRVHGIFKGESIATLYSRSTDARPTA